MIKVRPSFQSLRYPLCVIVAALALLALPASAPVTAQSQSAFDLYLDELLAQARRAGVSERTLNAVRPTLTLSESALRIEQRARDGGGAPGTIPPFIGSDEQRAIIGKAEPGRAKLLALGPLLRRIEADTGVPAGVILAIFGKESNFGANKGSFDVPSVLATLAFEGRRRELFAGEFVAAMQMIERGVPRERLRGSFAGAMGNPQFLPSVYLRLAADGNGDGEADIWNSEADTAASIARYLAQSGWRRGEPWGMAVAVPATLDRAAIASRLTSPRCPRVFARHSRWLTIAEWRQMGVIASGRRQLADNVQATLFEPDGPSSTAYLLTGNYRAILDYNCSNFYALSVGLLADDIES